MNFVQPIRDPEIMEDIKLHLKDTNERNYILFMLGINTGLRISDLLRIRVRDVLGTHISLREKKTKKEKRILITPELKKALVHFVKDKLPHEYLIQSREGKNRPIGRSMAYKLIRQIADEFGLDDIGCHTLRKTFGYLFYHQTNKSIGMLMKFLTIPQKRSHFAILASNKTQWIQR